VIRITASLGDRAVCDELPPGALDDARRIWLGTVARDDDPKLALSWLIWGALDRRPWAKEVTPVEVALAVLALVVGTDEATAAFWTELDAGNAYDVDYVVTKTGRNRYQGALSVMPAAVGTA
jgi:hypothetical protein